MFSNHHHRPMKFTNCLLTVAITLLAVTVLQTEGRIKVLSTLDDETVYVVREKPIITNIDSPAKGMLVLSNPTNACSSIAPPPDNASLTISKNDSLSGSIGSDDFAWILLVSWLESDSCSLRTKMEYASAAGYTVVLLQDPSNFESESEPMLSEITPMGSSTPSFEYEWVDVGIYACTINSEDWEILRRNFTTEGYYLAFEDSNSMSGWFTYFIVGILAIGAVFFTIGLSYVLVQLLVLILLWIRESIVSRIQQIRRDRRRRLPASQLKKIPIQQWNSDMLQDICSICLESFVVSERVRILPCSHVFHQICIDPWLLKQRRKCPNCKRKIVFPDENRDSDSSSDDERTPLLRRSSSSRESTSRSIQTNPTGQSPNQQRQRSDGQHPTSGLHRFLSNSFASSNNYQEITSRPGGAPHQNLPSSFAGNNGSNSTSINDSADAGTHDGAPNHAQTDLKEKVDQLCARMENVGRKIKKKVKTNQSSKFENDSSSDLSTTVQPVLVSVTVEANHNIPDNDCDHEHYDGESQFKEQPSSSGSGNFSQSQTSKRDSQFEVKVVPDSANPTPSHTLPENSENHQQRGERSISSDLNT